MLRDIYIYTLMIMVCAAGIGIGYCFGKKHERQRIKQVLFQGQSVKTLTYEQFCKEVEK